MVIEPIGYVHSRYSRKYDAPRQPEADDRIDEAVIKLLPHRNYEQALLHLEGFERIWVISWFDQVSSWKPLVLPPRSSAKHGVFSTRSPHRPNPIGISVARIASIEGLHIRIQSTDLLDGTPVLDIKPYLPYADAFPVSRAGWVDELDAVAYNVTFVDGDHDTSAIAANLRAAGILAHVTRTLQSHPLPHIYKRTRHIAGDTFELAVQAWRIRYTIQDMDVVIQSIQA